MNNIVQYLLTTVYECSKDVATGKINCLEKQVNDALPVLNVSIWRTTTPMTAEEIIQSHKQIVENTNKDLTKDEPLRIMYGFPLMQYDEKTLKVNHRYQCNNLFALFFCHHAYYNNSVFFCSRFR